MDGNKTNPKKKKILTVTAVFALIVLVAVIGAVVAFMTKMVESRANNFTLDTDILKVCVIENDKMFNSNGKYIALDISCKEFLKYFSYNDIVTVSINGHSYDVPVCST